jgi:DNA-binding Lrp family transcriptional regulator
MITDSSIRIDALDRPLVQALRLDGRLPFSRIANALGVSEQTIARRYRRLCDAGVVRVVGLINAWRSSDSLFLRISTQPGSARPIGEALARRIDVSWVAVALGETEVTCALHTDDVQHGQALVAERAEGQSYCRGDVIDDPATSSIATRELTGPRSRTLSTKWSYRP